MPYLFAGSQRNNTKSKSCGTIKYKDQLLSQIIIPMVSPAIEKQTSLTNLFRAYPTDKSIVDSNKVICSRCNGKQLATINLKISVTPNVLIIVLKRNQYDTKNQKRVVLQSTPDITLYCSTLLNIITVMLSKKLANAILVG